MTSPNLKYSYYQRASLEDTFGMLQRFRSYDSAAQLSLMRHLQDSENGDPAQTHSTGRMLHSRIRRGKPRILLMGQKRSGKSSITQVVFHKMQPSDTLYIETTTSVRKEEMNSFLDFNIWDFPGHIDFTEPMHDIENIFGEIGALVWVIDAQDEYLESIAKLNALLLELLPRYPTINFEVFIHKTDGLSEDYRQDVYRDVVQRVLDELSDHGYEELSHVNFYMTSIYSHSIFEAFSKVCQRLIPQLSSLESLLNNLSSSCGIEKSYIFDVHSKIYIAADAGPQDPKTYEVCSDFIDVMVDINDLYGWDRMEFADDDGDAVRENEDYEVGPRQEESYMTSDKSGSGYLYLRGINGFLALVCIMGKDSPAESKALIDYNVGVFQEGVLQVLNR